jgi:hypothetical protein
MPNPLGGVRVKIDRSKKHLADLHRAVSAFKSRKPHDFVVDLDSQPGYEVYRFYEREPIPIEWSAVLGDCIHNMRSALDLLANALVAANGGTPTQYTAFPIGSDETNFRTSAVQRVNGASQAAIKLIKSLKPYRGGNWPLYRLHLIDVADKHQLLIPVAASNVMFGTRTDVVQNDALLHVDWMNRNLPRGKFPLKDGDEIFSFRRVHDADFEDNSKFQFGFEVAFGEGQIFDGEPLVPTLNDLLHFTEGLIDVFARNIFGLAAW